MYLCVHCLGDGCAASLRCLRCPDCVLCMNVPGTGLYVGTDVCAQCITYTCSRCCVRLGSLCMCLRGVRLFPGRSAHGMCGVFGHVCA